MHTNTNIHINKDTDGDAHLKTIKAVALGINSLVYTLVVML